MLKDIYLNTSQIPKRYLPEIPLTPSKHDEQTFIELADIVNNAKEFIDSGKNLLICSSGAGNGKTTFATKILKSYINQVQNLGFTANTPALFINVNNFLNEKKLSISDQSLSEKVNEISRAILTAKVVVFDDIADKSLSEFDMNTLYYWIDYRTSNMLSCIYTTNQLPEQLKQTLSGKVYSRVVNYSQIKYITDGDHRKAAL